MPNNFFHTQLSSNSFCCQLSLMKIAASHLSWTENSANRSFSKSLMGNSLGPKTAPHIQNTGAGSYSRDWGQNTKVRNHLPGHRCLPPVLPTSCHPTRWLELDSLPWSLEAHNCEGPSVACLFGKWRDHWPLDCLCGNKESSEAT